MATVVKPEPAGEGGVMIKQEELEGRGVEGKGRALIKRELVEEEGIVIKRERRVRKRVL